MGFVFLKPWLSVINFTISTKAPVRTLPPNGLCTGSHFPSANLGHDVATIPVITAFKKLLVFQWTCIPTIKWVFIFLKPWLSVQNFTISTKAPV